MRKQLSRSFQHQNKFITEQVPGGGLQEEVQQPPPPATSGDESGVEDRRMKVEGDLDIGNDLLEIPQRHNIEDIESEIRSRGNDHIHNSSQVEIERGNASSPPGRHSSWDLSPEVGAINSKERYH